MPRERRKPKVERNAIRSVISSKIKDFAHSRSSKTGHRGISKNYFDESFFKRDFLSRPLSERLKLIKRMARHTEMGVDRADHIRWGLRTRLELKIPLTKSEESELSVALIKAEKYLVLAIAESKDIFIDGKLTQGNSSIDAPYPLDAVHHIFAPSNVTKRFHVIIPSLISKLKEKKLLSADFNTPW